MYNFFQFIRTFLTSKKIKSVLIAIQSFQTHDSCDLQFFYFASYSDANNRKHYFWFNLVYVFIDFKFDEHIIEVTNNVKTIFKKVIVLHKLSQMAVDNAYSCNVFLALSHSYHEYKNRHLNVLVKNILRINERRSF
jgi:hypothetical protein